MYKGIKIKNSQQPNYISDSRGATYSLRDTQNNSLAQVKEQTVNINNLPADILDISGYFSVNQTFSYHNTVMFTALEPEEQRGMSTDGLPYYEFYDKFSYNSTQYNDFAANYSEVELPNFYLSKEIEEISLVIIQLNIMILLPTIQK